MRVGLGAKLMLATMLSLSILCVGCASDTTANEAAQTEQSTEDADQTKEGKTKESDGQESEETADDQSLQEDKAKEDLEAGSGTYEGSEPNVPNPYVKEACWWTSEGENGTYVYIAVLMGNTDSINCYVFPTVTATAYDDSEAILGTEEMTTEFVAPADVMPMCSMMKVGEAPARVDFIITPGEGAIPGHPYTLASFAIDGTSEQKVDDQTTRWTGQYTNGCEVDFPNGCNSCALLRREGKLVAGYISYSSVAVTDGETRPFSVENMFGGDVPEHDSFDIYIIPNLL